MGLSVAIIDGPAEGMNDGSDEGQNVGKYVGAKVGNTDREGREGDRVGSLEGSSDGEDRMLEEKLRSEKDWWSISIDSSFISARTNIVLISLANTKKLEIRE